MQRIVFDNENKKSYEIADSSGNVRGVIYVDTTDFDIFTRAEKAAENMQQIMNNKNIPASESAGDKAALELINTTDKLMKEQIDFVFGEGVSEVVFGDKNCLNLRGGKTLAEVFIDVIIKEISRDMDRQNSLSQKKINKYTGAYNSSGHRRKNRRKGGK